MLRQRGMRVLIDGARPYAPLAEVDRRRSVWTG
jgi:hypothetical protein